MQGPHGPCPDCSNQAAFVEVSQLEQKDEYCFQSRPAATSLTTLAGYFAPLVESHWKQHVPPRRSRSAGKVDVGVVLNALR